MKKFFTQETTGHDWYHIERVWKNAQKIAAHYPEANPLQIELAALLHDRYDYKIVSNVEQAKLEVRDLLVQHGLTKELIEKISLLERKGLEFQPTWEVYSIEGYLKM